VAVEIAHQVVDFLSSGTITNSVNAPSVPQELAPILAPYLVLARRLGQFLTQVETIEPRRITIECAGDAAQLATGPIISAALAGTLSRFFEQPVNDINAPLLARDRGIEVQHNKTTHTAEYTTLVTLRVADKDGGEVTVSGTLAADRTPRLVRWGVHDLDAHLTGSILVMKNVDRPGVIGSIGSILGASKTNVSRMQMGLDTSTGQAASLWALDSALPGEVLERIRQAQGVEQAWAVGLS
jgi:D-3-phosphoglycerate dehydrogenase